MTILSFFQFLWVIFAVLDPDPGPRINADPQLCLYLRRCDVAGHQAAGEAEAASPPAVRSGRDLQGITKYLQNGVLKTFRYAKYM
jgi:hypothetical protein